MPIDIDKLTEAELIDLNHRIVARLRFLRQLETHVTMLEFRIGERVRFHPEGRPSVTGMVTRDCRPYRDLGRRQRGGAAIMRREHTGDPARQVPCESRKNLQKWGRTA